jgi:hypothetical protein
MVDIFGFLFVFDLLESLVGSDVEVVRAAVGRAAESNSIPYSEKAASHRRYT